MIEYTYSNAEENRFWLKVLSLKAQVLYNSIPPEKPETPRLNEFIRRFDTLYAQAKTKTSNSNIIILNQDAYRAATEFRTLSLELLRKQLTESFYLNIKPTYTNHIVNICEAYMAILNALMQGKQPEYNAIEQDIFWLPAYLIDARLFSDSVEFFSTVVRAKSMEFEKKLTDLYIYAETLQGFEKTGVENLPIVQEYRQNLFRVLEDFAAFTTDLWRLARANKLPGTLTFVELEINYRILCYHAVQIAVIEKQNKPTCDPGTERIF